MTDTDLSYDLIRATDTDPDQYARALELAQPRQAPPLAVLSNLSEAERLEKIDRLRSVIGDAPKLQQALQDDPNLLYLATDSIEPLSALEKVGDVLKSAALGAVRVPGQIAQGGYEATAALGDQAGRLVYQVFNGPLPEPTDTGSPDQQWLADAVSRARQAEERRAGLRQMPGFDFVRNTLDSIDTSDVPAYRQNIATDIGQALGNFAGQAAGGLGLGELFGSLSLYSQGYQQGAQNAEESGVYGTPQGDAGALLTAGVTGASEKVGLDLLTRPLARTGIAGRLAGLALGAGGEGLSEGVEQFGQNLVQRYVMGDQSVDPFDDVGYNTFLGLVTGGFFRAGVEGATMAKERADATTARNEALAQGLTGVMNSPLGQRSPEAARATAAKLLSDDPDATFSLPAEQARELFQSDDAVILPEDVRADLDRKITAGLASGADIDIPVSLLAHAAQAGKIDQVLQHARFADGDLTGAEAQEISLKDIGQEAQRMAQALLNSIQPEQEQQAVAGIRDDIARQLEAIGTAPDVAAQYAEVEANRLLARAARRGVDVQSMYKASPISITGDFGGITVGGRTLYQPGRPVDDLTPADVLKPETLADVERAVAEFRSANIEAGSQVEDLTAQVEELSKRERALAVIALRPLMRQAEDAKSDFDRLVTETAESAGGSPVLVPVKGIDRAAEKLITDYDGDTTKMRDLLRATIVVPSGKDLQAALDGLASRFKLDRVKNRTNETLTGEHVENAGPSKSGYSDVLVNVRLDNGMIAEIQISTPHMLAAKKVGHQLYSIARNLTPGDSRIQALRALEKKLYAEALEAALTRSSSDLTMDKNRSLETGVPYEKAFAEFRNGLSTGSNATADPSGSSTTGTSSTSTSSAPLGSDAKSISNSPEGDTSNVGPEGESVKDRTLEQPDGSGGAARGSVTFTSAGTVIRLFENRNLSTVIHEFGHIWAEELREDGTRPGAPEQLKQDWEIFKEHFGIKDLSDGAEIPTDAHEGFARTVEAYFMKGKAPSLAMAGLMNRFRAWFTNIYRSIRNLNVNLTPEIEGVLDRLLATDDQIAAMQASEAWTTLDQTLLDAGLTDAERKRYTKLAGEARDEAERAVMDKVMAEVRADHRQALKDMRPQIREQVEQDANTDQHLLAVEWIKEKGALSRTAVEDVLGADGAKGLQRGLVKKGGADPEMVAPLLGYESGSEMLQALAQTPTRKQWVEAETERRLVEAFPDPIVTGEAQNAGWAAIHSDKRAEVLALELKALRKLRADQMLQKGAARQQLGESTPAAGQASESRQIGNLESKAQEVRGDQSANTTKLAGEAKAAAESALRQEAAAASGRWKSELEALPGELESLQDEASAQLAEMTDGAIANADRLQRAVDAKAKAVETALVKRDYEKALSAKKEQIVAEMIRDGARTVAQNNRDDQVREQTEKNTRRKDKADAVDQWRQALAAVAEKSEAVRVAAQNAASQMTVADLLRTDRHRSAEARAAAEVQTALTRRDFEAAIEAKTRQIYAHHLARASAEAREATQKRIKSFARVLSDRVKMNIDPDYRARARQLLAAYDFGPKLGNRQQMLLELQAFNEWIQAKQQDDAAQFVIPERILQAQQLTNYRDMTYADFQALGDSVDNVITQGRLKNRLLAERDKIALDQARAELADTVRQNVRENGRPEIGTERFQRLRDTLRGVLSSLKKTETLIKELDGGKENGPWAQLIYKPLSDAADAETTRKAAAVKDLQNLFSVFGKADLKAMSSKISVPELNGSLSKWELLSFALNTGNESSLEALIEGYKIKPETVSAVIDRYLTKRDMDFVQSVWNYVNSFWPDIAAQEKRLTGVEPAKVAAMPLQTSHGTYAGGYYPLKYRSDSKPNSAAQIAEENYRQMIGGGVNRAATRHGHTIERQGSGGRRVALDIGILFGHIDSVIHDLTHREAVIDTHRLLTGGNVHSALVDTVGQEGYLTIDQTIRAVAGGQVAPTDDWQRVVQYVRGGTVVRALGLNLANALQNLTGVLPATALVGEKRMAMHALPFLARPDQWRAQMAWIRGKSPMMAARLQNFDRDVFQFGASLDPRRARRIKFQSWVNAPVAYTDNLTAGAVWTAAYNKAMEGEAGVNAEESAAVAYADSVVRRSLSSGRQLDLAQVQRGNEYMKLLTTFIGYFQAIYNLNVENVKNLQQGNIGATRAAVNLLLINIIPATIGQAMLGGPDDDESWWHWLAFANLRWLTGGIPLVRDLASVAQFGTAAKSPIAQVGEDFGRAGQGVIRMFTDDDVTRAQYRGMVNTVGTLAHLPTNQAWKTGDALLRWLEGEDGIGLYDAVVGAPAPKR